LFHEEQSAIECNQKKTLLVKGVSVCCRFFKKREEINPQSQLNSTTQQQVNLRNLEKIKISQNSLIKREHSVLETPNTSNGISPVIQVIKRALRPNNKLLNDMSKLNECATASQVNPILSHRLRFSGKHEGYLIVTGDIQMAQIVESNHFSGNIAIRKGLRPLLSLKLSTEHVRNETENFFSNIQSETVYSNERP
jgi:hypothetical protein